MKKIDRVEPHAMPNAPSVLYEVVPFHGGWQILKPREPEFAFISPTMGSVLTLISEEIAGSGVLCKVRVRNKNGGIDDEFCFYSPAKQKVPAFPG